ncbi:MAG TPA: glycosyltransferase [Patescibacteria group bacterium]|nr:glycosyltransferase [Patescibacteria group bacterium]
MKNLIKQFNSPETFMIISDYPEINKKGEKNYGIAWYTKKLIEPLSKQFGNRFIVLAEKANDNRPKLHEKNKILVLRVFDQKHPFLFPRILKWMFKFNKVTNIHVHSEFCTNGGMKNFILTIPFFLLIKLTGKHITYFSHNVVLELNSIAPHLGLKKNSLKLKTINLGLHYYYRILGLMVDKFVVMDEVMAKRLKLFVKEDKILLHPFWVEPAKSMNKQKAREIINKKFLTKFSHVIPAPRPSEALREGGKAGIQKNKDWILDQVQNDNGINPDDFVLLYFGFLTYYKGADWLIKTVKQLRKQKQFQKLHLILAGGEAYSLKDKAYYKKYYKSLLREIKDDPNIQITGFVAEKDIATYFSAADAVAFTYRGLIGGSGSLTLTLAHHKPFILSERMQELVLDKDIISACKINHIQPSDLIFSYTADSLAEKLIQLQNPVFRQKLTRVAISIAEARSKPKLLNNCYNQLYATNSIPAQPHKGTQLARLFTA